MRIDNPTADQIRKGDLVHFKPQTVDYASVSDNSVSVGGGWWVLATRIDYITREDTLEVGDEFTLGDRSYKRTVLAVVDNFVMYLIERQKEPDSDTIERLRKDHGFKILRKHNDPR